MGIFKKKKYVTMIKLRSILSMNFASILRDIKSLNLRQIATDSKIMSVFNGNDSLRKRNEVLGFCIGSMAEILEETLTKKQLDKVIDIGEEDNMTIGNILSEILIALD